MPDPIDPNADENATPTPPWGAEENFDPATAWQLIQNLRAEKVALKTKADTPAPAGQAPAEAPVETPADIAAAVKRAEAAERALYVERALRKHAVPEDLQDLVTGDNEEAILAIAERLAKHSKATETPEDAGDPAPDVTKRPKPALKPGHNGEDKVPLDLDAIAATARNSY